MFTERISDFEIASEWVVWWDREKQNMFTCVCILGFIEIVYIHCLFILKEATKNEATKFQHFDDDKNINIHTFVSTQIHSER